MELLKKSLEQIVSIVENEAYDDQARQYIKQWAMIALQELKNVAK